MSIAIKEKRTANLSQLELRNKRIAIYKKNVFARNLFKGVNGETFHIPESLMSRQANFKEFVKINFEYGFTEYGAWPNNVTNLPVYKKLKAYSETNYGAATIYRILQDNKKAALQKRKVFKVQYDDGVSGQTPQGAFNYIILPKNFPDNRPYSGGERKYDLAIIHHEFGHTRFFRKSNNMKKIMFTLNDERRAVIYLENPIRMKKGMEPRYTYYRKRGENGEKGTINIITGDRLAGLYTILENDPTKLVKLGSKGAYRR